MNEKERWNCDFDFINGICNWDFGELGMTITSTCDTLISPHYFNIFFVFDFGKR